MKLNRYIAIVGVVASTLAFSSVSNASTPSPTPTVGADIPRTVGEALGDVAYLSQFDTVDLSVANPSTPVVDSRLTAQSTNSQAKATSSCLWTAFTSITGGYGPVSQGCGFAGGKGSNKGYNWTHGSASGVCALGRGFNSSNVSTWYYAGCGSGTYSVPWGNNLAMSQFKVSGPAMNMIVVNWST